MTEQNPRLTRRQALGLMGAAGAVYIAGRSTRAPFHRARLTLGPRLAEAATASCVLTPEKTEGPYFVEERLQRSDIRVDPTDGSVSAGVPLGLKINVYRADDGCTPQTGAYVDVWHADAQGSYSDVAQNGTVGRKFLRGYQVTDANGTVEFTTIYPGWHPGRTIHIHFKVRTFDGSQTSYEFTSQLFFDDAVSDQILAVAPYASRGARDTTNDTDTIFGDASTLLVPLAADGSGGYAGTFSVGLTGLPAGGGVGATCADVTACRAAVEAALPDPTAATDRKSRRVAKGLGRLSEKANRALDRATSATNAARRQKQSAKARDTLGKLLARARAADGAGTLGVSLAPLEAAATALLGLL